MLLGQLGCLMSNFIVCSILVPQFLTVSLFPPLSSWVSFRISQDLVFLPMWMSPSNRCECAVRGIFTWNFSSGWWKERGCFPTQFSLLCCLQCSLVRLLCSSLPLLFSHVHCFFGHVSSIRPAIDKQLRFVFQVVLLGMLSSAFVCRITNYTRLYYSLVSRSSWKTELSALKYHLRSIY